MAQPNDQTPDSQTEEFPRYRDSPDDETPPNERENFDVWSRSVPDDEVLDNLISPDDVPSKTSWQRRLQDRIPKPLQRVARSIAEYTKGPDPPRPYKIEPFLPGIQTAPLRLRDRYLPKRSHKVLALIAFYICWIVTFGAVLRKSAFAGDVPGYGAPQVLTCTDRYWWNGNGCGLNGDFCRPFDNRTMAFRCPANCKRVMVYNPHAVGDQEINYRPLVIGGIDDEVPNDNIYRADSFICGAAIHHGLISDKQGGCGALALTGEGTNYRSQNRHGIDSISFDSSFPKSFSFISGTHTQCHDLRWPLLAVSLVYTILLSLLTTSPAVFFISIFAGLFFHVGLVSDPPSFTSYYSIISTSFGRFLPAAFVMAVMYRYFIRRTLSNLTAQVEKTVLWLGACWVGALNNYTFDRIPIQRLTPTDLKQPGAVPALIIIVLSIFFIALGQAYALRVEGRMRTYLAIYGTMGFCLLMLVAVPRMNVRIHHYILALLLLPGTSMQNRPSLLYQGLLVGLFINGIARWGFDSILQTPGELLGDGQRHTPLPVLAEVLNTTMSITFSWGEFPKWWDGISVLVNDVERFRGHIDFGPDRFAWKRMHEEEREYFRFAFLSGSGVGDYTKAGIWEPDGRWIEMEPGPSLKKRLINE